MEHANTGNGQIHDFWHKNRDSTTKTKTSRTVAKSPGFKDQKETFRIILANRTTCFYQMTQTVDVHRSKSSFASSLMFVSESSTIQLSLSHTCAHDILLVTILTMPISISSLLSCTLAPGSCKEGCKPLLYQLRVSQVVCGPPPRAPPTSPHFPSRPSSRAPSHPPPSPYP